MGMALDYPDSVIETGRRCGNLGVASGPPWRLYSVTLGIRNTRPAGYRVGFRLNARGVGVLKLKAVVFTVLLTFSGVVGAASSAFYANVTQIFVHDTTHGGCLVKLSKNPATYLPACGANWLSLDCLAEFPESTRSIASQKLGMAQLAFITSGQVRVEFTDSRTVNGYCFARRLDVR